MDRQSETEPPPLEEVARWTGGQKRGLPLWGRWPDGPAARNRASPFGGGGLKGRRPETEPPPLGEVA